jgi:dTDP-4-dehydrorhamnose 3,5-epimerase
MTTSFKPQAVNKISDRVYKTKIEGLFYIAHKVAEDDRGFYKELARIPTLDEFLDKPFVAKQLSHSRSKKNVIRGFHAESWNKLATITSGACFCALADIRKNSKTFGLVETFLLGTTENTLQGTLFISNGIANSFCVIEGPADYVYAFDKLWDERDPTDEQAINLFDPTLAVKWPIKKEDMIISMRDKNSVDLDKN